MSENKLYPERYGAWSGKPSGFSPNYERCCEEVTFYTGRWPHRKQCDRKRGHGPDQAYCKQHDPAAVEKRRAESDRREKADWNKRRYGFYGRRFFNALKQIADGHNDPRSLASEVIKEFLDGESK